VLHRFFIKWVKGLDCYCGSGLLSKDCCERFSPEVVEVDFNLSKEKRAMNLLLRAFESSGEQRYQLAKKAVEYNPSLTEAYLILGEGSASIEEGLIVYEKALELAIDDIGGVAFLEANKYRFGELENYVPYLQAKLFVGFYSHLTQRFSTAIQHLEELLDLVKVNFLPLLLPLFPAYIEVGQLEKAKELLERFPTDSTHRVFNELLLELSENGASLQARRLMKIAEKTNTHVVKYLKGKKVLIYDHLPDEYEFGGDEEAIAYLSSTFNTWKRIGGLDIW
jgi:tetratricopeptide (TPR) repeat protein